VRPGLYPNAVTGNQRDTLLLEGGVLTTSATLPKYPGVPWRVRGPVFIDGGATLAIAPGDTVAFDDSTFIQVGVLQSGNGALSAVSTPAEPILLTASGAAWWGIHFADIGDIEGCRPLSARGGERPARCSSACWCATRPELPKRGPVSVSGLGSPTSGFRGLHSVTVRLLGRWTSRRRAPRAGDDGNQFYANTPSR
jgi:hypothetical protein